MNGQRPSSLLHQFDLLPPSFRYQYRLRGVFRGWVALVCLLLTVLIGTSALTIMRKLHANRTNQQIASAAIPLLDLRRDVFRLQEENKQRHQRCRWIQSTRPDDSMLQILAAIAASQSSDPTQSSDQSQTSDQQIIVDSVSLRLAMEFPISAPEPPPWAVPFVTIVARSTSPDVVQPWVERLNSFDRITAASIAENPNETASDVRFINKINQNVRLTATPVATRVQP